MKIIIHPFSCRRRWYSVILFCAMLIAPQNESRAIDTTIDLADQEVGGFLTNIGAQCTAVAENDGMIQFILLIRHPGHGNEWFLRLHLRSASTNVAAMHIKGVERRASAVFGNDSNTVYQQFRFMLAKDLLETSSVTLFEAKPQLDYSLPPLRLYTSFKCHALYAVSRKSK